MKRTGRAKHKSVFTKDGPYDGLSFADRRLLMEQEAADRFSDHARDPLIEEHAIGAPEPKPVLPLDEHYAGGVRKPRNSK